MFFQFRWGILRLDLETVSHSEISVLLEGRNLTHV